jgi:hypothetical protein
MANLALTFGIKGNGRKPKRSFCKWMETSLRVLGEEHPSTLICINNHDRKKPKGCTLVRVNPVEVILEASFYFITFTLTNIFYGI